ncbi:Granzyme B [Camelus dromedarius]|uniref:Granzyme B n=1 Tax=Camelus dromedarius TaxID=9838 RepID=A0A5N4E3M5_CAMDR|nr:Granzyme B [Camelus dromedarius]
MMLETPLAGMAEKNAVLKRSHGCKQARQTFPSGEIIGGHEAKPHSRPYMAYLQIWNQDVRSRCGGFLIREDFVLTAAHCWGSSINVTLGAHNIKKQERTQQVIPVRKAIRHPDYNKRNYANDIMLLQLQRKAKQTAAVRPLRLPGDRARVKPGQACDVAGWGRVAVAMNNYPDTLQEVKLIVQEDQKCESHLRNYYNNIIQLCVGDPKKKKASFKVRMTECLAWLWEIWDLRTQVLAPSQDYWCSEQFILHSDPGTDQKAVVRISEKPCRMEATTSEETLKVKNTGRKNWAAFVESCSCFCSWQPSSVRHRGRSSISITLGAHNILEQEGTQQVIRVRRAIPHPDDDDETRPTTSCYCRRGAWDSGGPLLCNSVAQGIVSFGTKDGTPSSVYTRISSFLYWIQNTMRICELQGPD